MPLTYAYADAYLASRVTEARENAAVAYVSDLGTFPVDWTERLVILRAYIVTCMESMQAPDDLFAAKLAAYRKEYADTLTSARAAQSALDQAAGDASSASVFSIALERS